MERSIFLLLLCFIINNAALAASSCGNCLHLTPYIKNGKASQARTASEVNSTSFLGHKSHSGFMTVREDYNNNLFFWFFPAKTPLETTPWIIWLQGGPGVTSMLGLFELIGPVRIKNGEVKQSNVTWSSDYSLVFVDNPVGAGYSFTDDERGYPDNEDDVGSQLLEFIVQFLEMFPEMRNAPLFISGQSYAGKYVPALGIQIHRHNQRNNNHINLRGLTIGNGLMQLRDVMHYSELCRSLGLLDGAELDVVASLDEQVVKLIDDNQLVEAANKFNETIEYIKKKSGVNIYNFIRDPSSKAPEFEEYVTREDVRHLIHVGNATFVYNNQHVYYKMLPDFANTTKPFVEELLDHYGVMSYSGQLDVILPYSLSKYMYQTLQWSRREDYIKATRTQYRRRSDGPVAGYIKKGGNFVEVFIRNAGHSVPSDQPDVIKSLIDDFINAYK